MAREIKFRAWDKQNKQMLEVGDIQFGVKHGMGPGDLVDYVGTPYGSRYYIVDRDVELMQYTGLKDCKGKEIYESDIVADDDDGELWLVVWDNGGCGFEMQHSTMKGYCDRMVNFDWLKIKGNLYEHPELIKKRLFVKVRGIYTRFSHDINGRGYVEKCQTTWMRDS